MNDNWVTAMVMDSMFAIIAVVHTEEELMMARMLDNVYRINYYDADGFYHRTDGPSTEWPRLRDGVYSYHGKMFYNLVSLKKWANKQAQKREKGESNE